MLKKQRKIPKIRASSQSLFNLVGYLFLTLILAIFLSFNVFQSQSISPLYFQIANEEKKAAVEFLKKIKELPQFKNFLATAEKIYGNPVENDVFSDENQKKQLIKNLELVLKKNPRSRDVIYKLYLVNKELGNDNQANHYLKLAKEIDPGIK